MLATRIPAALIAATLLAPALGQTEVNVAPSFEEGETFSYRLSRDLTLEQKPRSGDDEQDVREVRKIQDADIAFEVRDVANDGALTVAARVEAVRLSVREGDTSFGYAFPPIEREEGDGEPEPWDTLGVTLSEATIVFDVSPEGEVSNVRGLDAFNTAASEAGPGAELAGVFDATTFANNIQPIFACDGAVGATREVGKGWETSDTIPLGAVGVMDFTYSWRMAAVENGNAIFIGQPSVQLRRPAEPADTIAQVALGSNSGFIRDEWNVRDQRLSFRDSRLILTTTWTLGDMSIEQTQNSKSELRRRN